MTTSKPLYVYLQRPDDGAWVTLGRYLPHPEQNRWDWLKAAPTFIMLRLWRDDGMHPYPHHRHHRYHTFQRIFQLIYR